MFNLYILCDPKSNTYLLEDKKDCVPSSNCSGVGIHF